MRNLILLLTMLFSSVTFGALSEVDRQEIGYTNYIKNGGCESGVAGLSRYADAAGTRPVDGTGGAPTVSVSASATAPLIGKASCIFTKSATNVQGQGWSIPFTIEEGAKGKVLSVEFLYKVDSGTFAAGSPTTDSDVIAYLYDVTNGVVIEPTSFKLLSNSTTLADKFSGYFQAPSNSTSYRLIFHVATTSASAYALKVDDIAVSRSKITSGAVITDPVDYSNTITLGAGFGTPANKKIYWERKGKFMRIFGTFTTGTVASATGEISLPSGYSIDANYYQNTAKNLIGKMEEIANAAGAGGTVIHRVGFDGTTLDKVWLSSASNGNLAGGLFNKTNVNSAFGSASSISLDIIVPIQGWSSNTQLSSDAGNSVTAFYTTTSASATPNAITKLINSVVITDKSASYSTVTGEYTAPSSGEYEFYAGFLLGTGAANPILYFYKNGTQVGNPFGGTGAANYAASSGKITIPLVAGDKIDYRVISGGTGVQIQNGYSYFGGYKISNPQTIAANDTVAASYWMSANQTTAAQINFDSKEFDYTGAVSTGVGTWRFTASQAGLYSINVFANAASSYSLSLYKNNVKHKYLGLRQGVANVNFNMGTTVRLLAGEYIDVRPNASNTFVGGAIDADLTSRIEITRVGNY